MKGFLEHFFYALTLIMILIIGFGFVGSLFYWVINGI